MQRRQNTASSNYERPALNLHTAPTSPVNQNEIKGTNLLLSAKQAHSLHYNAQQSSFSLAMKNQKDRLRTAEYKNNIQKKHTQATEAGVSHSPHHIDDSLEQKAEKYMIRFSQKKRRNSFKELKMKVQREERSAQTASRSHYQQHLSSLQGNTQTSGSLRTNKTREGDSQQIKEQGGDAQFTQNNGQMLQEIDTLQQISRFHDNYFQFQNKNNFRTKEIDTSKFWKEQFRDNKQLYYLFDYKDQKNKQQNTTENYFFSFKKNIREQDSQWMIRIQQMVENLDYQELKSFKYIIQAGKEEWDRENEVNFEKLSRREKDQYMMQLLDVAMEYLYLKNVNLKQFQKKELKEATDRVKSLVENMRKNNPKQRRFFNVASPNKGQTNNEGQQKGAEDNIFSQTNDGNGQKQLSGFNLQQLFSSQKYQENGLHRRRSSLFQKHSPVYFGGVADVSTPQQQKDHTEQSAAESSLHCLEEQDDVNNMSHQMTINKFMLKEKDKSNSLGELRRKSQLFNFEKRGMFLVQAASLNSLDNFLRQRSRNSDMDRLRKIIINAYQQDEPDIINIQTVGRYDRALEEQFSLPEVQKILETQEKNSPRDLEENLSQVINNELLSGIMKKTIQTVNSLDYLKSQPLRRALVQTTEGVQHERVKMREVHRYTPVQQLIDKGQNFLAHWQNKPHQVFNYNKKELIERVTTIKKLRVNPERHKAVHKAQKNQIYGIQTDSGVTSYKGY